MAKVKEWINEQESGKQVIVTSYENGCKSLTVSYSKEKQLGVMFTPSEWAEFVSDFNYEFVYLAEKERRENENRN